VRRFALVGAIASLAFAVLGVAPQRSEGPPLRDFEAYYAAGDTWHYRGDPYGRDIWRTEKDVPGVIATRDELLPFVGPPFGLPLWSTFARLPWRAASLAWGMVLGFAFATIVVGSLAFGRAQVRWFDVSAALLFACAFAPLTGGTVLGQVAVVSCAAIVAMPFILRPRRTLGAVGLALVAALQPNLAIALVARLAETRTWIAFGGAAALAAGLSAVALGGPSVFAQYADVLRQQGNAERFSAIQTTPGAVAYALGAAPGLADGLAFALAIVCVAALVAQAVVQRYTATTRLWLACALVPLMLPFAHQHEYTIVFLPALVLVVRARGALWATGAIAAVALGVDWLGLVQRPHALAAAVGLAAASACAAIALARGPLRPYHAAPLGVALVVVAVGLLAAAHPLPTWPDALARDFRVGVHASAPAVWYQEQLRSGIMIRDPFSGALRAIALVACAVIWFCASLTLATVQPKLGSRAR